MPRRSAAVQVFGALLVVGQGWPVGAAGFRADERLCRVTCVAADFDGPLRQFGQKRVGTKVLRSIQHLLDRKVPYATISGRLVTDRDRVLKSMGLVASEESRIAGRSDSSVTARRPADPPLAGLHVLLGCGAEGYLVDASGRVRPSPRFEPATLAGRQHEVAARLEPLVRDHCGGDFTMRKTLHGVSLGFLGIGQAGLDRHGPSIFRDIFRILKRVDGLPSTVSVVRSREHVDIVPATKAQRLAKLLALHPPPDPTTGHVVALIFDSVFRGEAPGNDYSLAWMTPKDIHRWAPETAHWPIDLIKLYVGREEAPDLPLDGRVIVADQPGPESTRAFHEAILRAKGRGPAQ